MLYGIDVSRWNGTINWNTVKVDFVLCKVSEKANNVEPTFRENYEGATKAGIPVGGYKYVYAKTVETARKEAEAVVSILGGKKLPAKFWIDMEDASIKGLGKAMLTKIIDAEAEILQKAGYEVGIYCNRDWYRNVLDSAELSKRYPFWIARYPSVDDGTIKESLRPEGATIWQYSSKGRVSGINGNVDMNIAYTNFIENSGSQSTVQGDTSIEPAATAVLKKGQSGSDIVWLQQMLSYKFGFDCGSVNGEFDEQTYLALKNFQLYYGLEIDGMAGPATIKTLKESDRVTPKNTYAFMLQRALNAELDARLICDGQIGPKTLAACPVIYEGQTSQVIHAYKAMLSQVYGYPVNDINTGYFTSDVTDSTKKFQASRKLTADGKVGPKTWKSIGNDF